MFLKRKKNYQINKKQKTISNHPDNNIFQTLLKNTSWNIIGGIAILLLQLLTIPYIVNKLGDAQYGIWSLANILVTYFFFLDIGISTACTKFLSEKYNNATSEEINNIFWTALLLTTILGFTASILMAILSPFIIKKFFSIPDNLIQLSINVTIIYSFSLFFTFISGIIKSIPFALKRFDLINKIQLIISSILSIGTVLILYLRYSLIHIAILSLFTQLLSVIMLGRAAKKIAPELYFTIWKISLMTKLIKYGGFILISNIISPILMHIEKVFIGILISASMITYYIVPHNLLIRLWLISAGFSTAMFPTLSEISYYKDNILIKNTIDRAIKLVSSVIAWVFFGLFVFGDIFLKIWLGNDFALISTNILRILCVSFWLNIISHIIFTYFRASNKPQLPAIFHIIEVFIYIPSAYLLISNFNLIGAAIAWFIRIFLDSLMLIIAYQIIEKPDKFLFLTSIFNKATLTIFIFASILILIRKYSVISEMSTIILAIVFSITSFLIIWYKIFGFEEKELISKLLFFK